MKNSITSLFAIVFLFSQLALAKPRAYFDAEDSFFGANNRLVIDDKEVKKNFFSTYKISEHMQSNKKAAELARSYEVRQTWSYILMWGSLLGALTYAIDKNNTRDTRGRNDFDGGTYWAIIAVGFIPGIYLGVTAGNKRTRAINEYNSVYETEEKQSSFKTTSTPLGLTLNWNY